MDQKKKRRRLMIRRTIVCLCMAVILTSLIFGITVGINALCTIFGNRTGGGAKGAGSVHAARSSSAKDSGVAGKEKPSTAEPQNGSAPESWFNDAVFIGDSRTEGLADYDGLGNADYYAVTGLMVNTVYTKPAVRIGSTKVTVMQALHKKKFGKVYIMLGVNELGWSSFQSFVNGYAKMVDDIRKAQPQAAVYLQSILPVTAEKSDSSAIYTNPKINNYNDAIRRLAEQKKMKYLAVNTAVENPSGALPPDAAVDGIHLKPEYCRKWCDYIRTHID